MGCRPWGSGLEGENEMREKRLQVCGLLLWGFGDWDFGVQNLEVLLGIYRGSI